jgi:hypothetical protein
MKQPVPADAHVFIAHRRALPVSLIKDPQSRQFWVPGVGTWKKLAAEGLFVSGSTDGLGWQRMSFLSGTTLLNFPAPSSWHVLTHDQAAGWSEAGVVRHSTYSFEKNKDLDFEQALNGASHVFWGSARQFETYHSACSAHTHHACACGKTADHLVASGLNHYTIFPSRSAWQAWIKAPESEQHQA